MARSWSKRRRRSAPRYPCIATIRRWTPAACAASVWSRSRRCPSCRSRARRASTEGMVVHTMSPKVAEARRGVLEFLLLNHPLDCPICDKGGECDLQDFTMEYGPGASRLTEPKLHKPKTVDLGPTIVLDEERCILCRRCTRFDDEIAQERNLVVVERGHQSLIGTIDGGDYASYFSGNTTEICPVGALTSKAYRFRAAAMGPRPRGFGVHAVLGRLQLPHRLALRAHHAHVHAREPRGRRRMDLRPRALHLQLYVRTRALAQASRCGATAISNPRHSPKR